MMLRWGGDMSAPLLNPTNATATAESEKFHLPANNIFCRICAIWGWGGDYDQEEDVTKEGLQMEEMEEIENDMKYWRLMLTR